MPDIDPQVRDRNANYGAAPASAQPEVRPERGRSGRGAEIAVRALWLALGFALGVSAGLLWAGSVMAGG
ncbi:MAG: hypothetical protein BGO37_02910 [Cellulomonas sp. 73-92]|uniref:hypothetical protein n=1 Tax=Cellulomonas sp. 73-92 TaxID=1895740 RepID=UPI0009271E40|nr:hypothetical protein [Cellulomonas sp. 73-92]OJV80337.1 MAG: hypothetical protein BGO37_02910 [Cellulomonas sp. 73-92]